MICTATEENVDVIMSGYAFRLKILHERGLSLLNRQSKIQIHFINDHNLNNQSDSCDVELIGPILFL